MEQDAYLALQDDRTIRVERAAENNLQHIDVDIPRDRLVVVTGVSGSGKSSLAFNTLHAEGQRRYLETFSAYARQFMGGLERPKVERITGLSPVIAIEQKTISRNPRSTVGTVTELLDFLRVLFARAATAYSSATGEPMVRFTDEGILSRIVEDYAGERLLLLAPLVRAGKGITGNSLKPSRSKAISGPAWTGKSWNSSLDSGWTATRSTTSRPWSTASSCPIHRHWTRTASRPTRRRLGSCAP